MAKRYLELSKTLKKLLFERNMKPIDLAREIAMPQPTIHRLITGKSTRPYKSSLKPIADYFSLTIEQLLGEEILPNNYWQENTSNLPSTQQIKTIPIISWTDVTVLPRAEYENKKSVISTGNISNESFALIMNDSSMEPLFPKYCTLIFDPLRQEMDRSFVLVKLCEFDIPVFRQILIDVNNKYIKPLNPDLNAYQMRLLSAEDSIIASLFESRINHQQENDLNMLEEIK